MCKQQFAKETMGIEDLLRGIGAGCPEEIEFGPTNGGKYGLEVTVGPVRVMILGDEEQWRNLADGMTRGMDKFKKDHPEHAGNANANAKKKGGDDAPPMNETSV